MGAYPQVVDWNNDGKKDLISGDADGKVWLFLNTGTEKVPVLAEGELLKVDGNPIVGTRPNYKKDKDGQYRFVPNTNEVTGIYSKIHVGDWDGDDLKDLLVGQDGPNQNDLVLYRNIGTTNNPVLARPVAIVLPGPAMSRPSPYLVDWDGDGRQDLLVGTESPRVYCFRNIGTKQKPEFGKPRLVGLVAKDFDKGYRCRIAVTDWNNDGRLDILVGNVYNANKSCGGNIWLFLAK